MRHYCSIALLLCVYFFNYGMNHCPPGSNGPQTISQNSSKILGICDTCGAEIVPGPGSLAHLTQTCRSNKKSRNTLLSAEVKAERRQKKLDSHFKHPISAPEMCPEPFQPNDSLTDLVRLYDQSLFKDDVLPPFEL